MSTSPSNTPVTLVELNQRSDLPLLVLGPSLGTSVTALWSACADRLHDVFHVVGWDLPGHGTNRATPPTSNNGDGDGDGDEDNSEDSDGAVSIGSLAAGLLEQVELALARRGEPGGQFTYAGDSVGGAVGLQLLLDAPSRIGFAVLICTGATIGEPQSWLDRAATVRAQGTGVLVENTAARWFSPSRLDREAEFGRPLLQALPAVDRVGYAQVCEALADFDVRPRLAEITSPVLAVAGADDIVTPVQKLREIAAGVGDGWLVILDQVGHLAPIEAPDEVAKLLRAHARTAHASQSPAEPSPSLASVRTAGMSVRREVLGAAHVDQATAAATNLTREFQEFITQYAWGTIWTRPGLDRRSRSMITLTALVARGHHQELALHLRAARTNGVSDDEIKELLLQTAIYCGVPDANTAFRIAQHVLDSTPEPPTSKDQP